MASQESPEKQSPEQILEGSCSCGRNVYTIHLRSPEQASLVIDTSLISRQTHSSPLPTFLRIPLHSLRSSTHAFFEDETHAQIRREYTPIRDSRTKRVFCGFCGTQLRYWQEDAEDRDVERWVNVNLGTLESDGVEELEDLGVLGTNSQQEALQTTSNARQVSGQPWFEELIRDTRIGRIRESRGGHTSNDGRSRFEWRVVEFDGQTMSSEDEEMNEAPPAAASKRKADDIET